MDDQTTQVLRDDMALEHDLEGVVLAGSALDGAVMALLKDGCPEPHQAALSAASDAFKAAVHALATNQHARTEAAEQAAAADKG